MGGPAFVWIDLTLALLELACLRLASLDRPEPPKRPPTDPERGQRARVRVRGQARACQALQVTSGNLANTAGNTSSRTRHRTSKCTSIVRMGATTTTIRRKRSRTWRSCGAGPGRSTSTSASSSTSTSTTTPASTSKNKSGSSTSVRIGTGTGVTTTRTQTRSRWYCII